MSTAGSAFRTALALGLAALLAGCSQWPLAVDGADDDTGCVGSLQRLQSIIDDAGAADRWHHRVPGQPTYRSTRFLASFADPPPAPPVEIAWRAALHETGLHDLGIEWRRLPAASRETWRQAGGEVSLEAFVQRCGATLWLASLGQPLDPAAVQVPDAYSRLQRAVGLFPLARWAAAPAVRAEQRRLRGLLTGPLPPAQASVLYEPPAPSAAPPAAPWPRTPLGLPRLESDALEALLARHAPRVQVLQAGPADRIGGANFVDGRRRLDPERPVLYTHLSHQRSAQGVLLQLNYTLWFPERPPAVPRDPYAGRFDGLVWRVTLAPDGRVLFHDSIHPCGCYHSVHLPHDAVWPERPEADDASAAPVVRNALPRDGPAPVLLLSAGEHQLLRVLREPWPGAGRQPYVLAEHDDLRATPDGAGGVRSWYDDDGLIGESARGERFFLWPLGIPSAGAMRQPGRHAIDFLGTRHFDDAWLGGAPPAR